LLQLDAGLRADRGFVRLARWIGRQRVPLEPPTAGHGERCNLALEAGLDLVSGQVRVDHHNGHDLFTEVGMGDAKHDGLLDTVDRHQCTFDGSRRDVLPAPDDHVLGAAGDPEVAAFVQAPEITGMQPTVLVDG